MHVLAGQNNQPTHYHIYHDYQYSRDRETYTPLVKHRSPGGSNFRWTYFLSESMLTFKRVAIDRRSRLLHVLILIILLLLLPLIYYSESYADSMGRAVPSPRAELATPGFLVAVPGHLRSGGQPSACYSVAPSSFSVFHRFLAQVPRPCGWLMLRARSVGCRGTVNSLPKFHLPRRLTPSCGSSGLTFKPAMSVPKDVVSHIASYLRRDPAGAKQCSPCPGPPALRWRWRSTLFPRNPLPACMCDGRGFCIYTVDDASPRLTLRCTRVRDCLWLKRHARAAGL